MSQRNDNRDWIRGTGDYEGHPPSEWVQSLVKRFGEEGALDFMDAVNHEVTYIDLRRAPWAGRPWLKEMVRDVRDAACRLAVAMYNVEADPDYEPPTKE